MKPQYIKWYSKGSGGSGCLLCNDWGCNLHPGTNQAESQGPAYIVGAPEGGVNISSSFTMC